MRWLAARGWRSSVGGMLRRERERSRASAGPSPQYTAMFDSAMKSHSHTCPPEASALIGEMSSNGESLDDMSESVEELREKLANMKRLMEERKGTTLGEISERKRRRENAEVIDGNFLSWIFVTVLVVILGVSFYAFYNLYHAVLKKFPSKHTEL